MDDLEQVKEQPVDLQAWKRKVHRVDMALRDLQNIPEQAPPKLPGAKRRLKRVLPSRP